MDYLYVIPWNQVNTQRQQVPFPQCNGCKVKKIRYMRFGKMIELNKALNVELTCGTGNKFDKPIKWGCNSIWRKFDIPEHLGNGCYCILCLCYFLAKSYGWIPNETIDWSYTSMCLDVSAGQFAKWCHEDNNLLLNITKFLPHYTDVIMGAIASQFTSLAIVYSTIYSDADQRKHQSSQSLAFVWGIHRGPVNSPYKWPVTRKNVFIWWRHHEYYIRFMLLKSEYSTETR